MLEKCCDIYINIIRQFLVISACNWRAFVAQWLEHWSCKPGVESSNLSEGFCPKCPQTLKSKIANFKSRGLNRDSNPGPLAPKARIIPLDH